MREVEEITGYIKEDTFYGKVKLEEIVVPENIQCCKVTSRRVLEKGLKCFYIAFSGHSVQ